MKILRSTKHSLKFCTNNKLKVLEFIRSEYSSVVNQYVDIFWSKFLRKSELLKSVLNNVDSWLSQRMKQQAAREAVDMITASKKRDKDKAVKPTHKGRMQLTSATCTLLPAKRTKEFDAWLQLRSIGSKMKLDLPIKYHRQFHKWSKRGKLLGSFVIGKNYVQISFEVETAQKKDVTNVIGIDTGINCLASLSTGEQIGKDTKRLINVIKRRRYGGKGHKRAISTLKSYISKVAKVITESDISLIVVENLKNITKNTKLKGRLSKSMRSSIGKWNVRYWLTRLQQKCEENRVSFRSVSAYYTSQTCNICGYVDRKNRSGEEFKCLKCNHQTNADVNAAKNILERFITGRYGAGYKAETMLLNTIV